jgi:hypothetical protein
MPAKERRYGSGGQVPVKVSGGKKHSLKPEQAAGVFEGLYEIESEYKYC